MSELPRLSREDVRAELEKHYGVARHHHLFAFFGTGEDSTVEVRSGGRFHIVPVQSELHLREMLAAYEDDDARAAFLVPWSHEIPLDLRGRFARSGKVLRVGRESRLQRLFGVAEVDDAARRSPLATYLLRYPPEHSFTTPSGRLTEGVLWEAWLTQGLGVDAQGSLALDVLLGWAAADGRGPELSARVLRAPVDDGGPPLEPALLAHLDARFGPAAVVVWRAWQEDRGARVLACAVLCEGYAQRSESVQLWIRQKLKQELRPPSDADLARVAHALGSATEGALLHFERRVASDEPTREQRRQRVYVAADAIIDEPSVREAFRDHPRLPSSWSARLETLGLRLSVGAKARSAGDLDAATEALAGLETHEVFRKGRDLESYKRAEMSVRLLAWLVARTDRRTEGQAAPYGDAVALGLWYAEEGGYVDWARAYARGSATGAFGEGIAAVVAAADDLRLELDRRFAKGLVAWVEAKRPATDIVPIDQALDRVAVPFLKGDRSRRLLVLLMDGMAWAQAVELLASLGEPGSGWGPLRWHHTTAGRIGSSRVPTVFAGLPTITEVSRAAFFGGKPLAPGEPLATSKDPARFEAHRGLLSICEGNVAPRLMLRGEASSASGSATQPAITLVEDPTRPVVGIVLNAIDASLKRDPQQHPTWSVREIRPLRDLLDAARRAGRAVLLASDHGHVPTTELVTRVGEMREGARWHARDDGPDDREELRFAGDGVWAPKGRPNVALLTTDRQRFGHAPNAGEHGGASLAEVVAPCLLLGPVTGGPEDDEGQEVVGAHVPDWWLLRVTSATPSLASAPPPRRRKKSSPQLELLAHVAPAEPPPAPLLARDPATHPLMKSKVFLAVTKKDAQTRVVRAVTFLHEMRGAASVEMFAAAMGEITWRASGLVAGLQEVLNVDGYQVLSMDHVHKQVRLDVAKLEQLFEVKL